jgi:hypothetical protein
VSGVVWLPTIVIAELEIGHFESQCFVSGFIRALHNGIDPAAADTVFIPVDNVYLGRQKSEVPNH